MDLLAARMTVAGEMERAQLRNTVARHRVAQEDARQVKGIQATRPMPVDPIGLTAAQREAAQLWADGYTYREIAARIGITKTAVKDRVMRARWRLAIPRGTPTAEARREVRARL